MVNIIRPGTGVIQADSDKIPAELTAQTIITNEFTYLADQNRSFFEDENVKFISAAYNDARAAALNMINKTTDADGKESLAVNRLRLDEFHSNVDETLRGIKEFLKPTVRGQPTATTEGKENAESLILGLLKIKDTANSVTALQEAPKSGILLREIEEARDIVKNTKAEKAEKKRRVQAPRPQDIDSTINSEEEIAPRVDRVLRRVHNILHRRGFQVLFDDARRKNSDLVNALHDVRRAAGVPIDREGNIIGNGEFNKEAFNEAITRAIENAEALPYQLQSLHDGADGKDRAQKALEELKKLKSDVDSAVKRLKISSLVNPAEFPKLAMGDTAKPAASLEEVAAGARFNVANVERAVPVSTTVGAVQRTDKSGTPDLV